MKIFNLVWKKDIFYIIISDYYLIKNMKDTFFVTTPIYYTNWVPHIWHAYSSIIADVIARYQRINSKQVKFSTWVDENSQKSLEKARELNMDIMPYLDMMAEKHKSVWDWLKLEYTDFIRTTEKRHHKLVSEVLQKSFDNWDIYEWIYKWMYCIGCEAFKKDEDLIYLDKITWKTFSSINILKDNENIIKVCPDHLREPEIIEEKNYFFRLSKYRDFLLNFYKENPDFVIPRDRFNEVIAFVERWLEDFSISRETNKFGIKLPFDLNQVTYVWYDALFNYVTVCQENDKWLDDKKFWPADLHIVWKDIIRFHAIYWPAMLKSAWYELPKQILTTWFFTINWQKISKSLWNVIDPVEFSKKYSKDLLILYLLSSFNIGQDWDFDEKQAILTYNAKLANNLWNLVNRLLVLSLKLKESWKLYTLKDNLDLKFDIESIKDYFSNFNLKWVLDESFKFLDNLNDFTTKKEPWQTIKDDLKQDETREVLYVIAEWLRQVGLALYPFFPDKMIELFEKIWLKNYKEQLKNWKLKELQNKKEIFEIKSKWQPLFKRIDLS